MNEDHGDIEHSLVAGLQIIQHVPGFIAVGLQVSRDDVHVIARADRLLLLFDFHSVDVCHLRLHHLDGRCLIQRLHMHIDDQVLIGIQEVLQHLIGKFRCQDVQKRHGSDSLSHLEISAAFKFHTGRCDIVLGGKSGLSHLVIGECKGFLLQRIQHLMH